MNENYLTANLFTPEGESMPCPPGKHWCKAKVICRAFHVPNLIEKRATFNLTEFDEIDLARQIEFGSTGFAELPAEARQLDIALVICRIKCINIQYIVVNA